VRAIRLAWPADAPPDTAEVFLAPDQARHGARVLRLAPGDPLEMTGPAGLAPAVVTVVQAGRDRHPPRLAVRLTGPWAGAETTPGPRLALALIQPQRFDWAVEKAVELGASSLMPFRAERGKPGLAAAGRETRWRRLAEEARKQCGRPDGLTILPAAGFDDVLAQPGPGFFLSPVGRLEPPGLDPSAPLLVVGPEGGFSPAEEEALLASGFRPWSLGNTVLRAETAALAALAVIGTARSRGGPYP
jgi:16S rRNA (uracil1498-N3)-methyltransferase